MSIPQISNEQLDIVRNLENFNVVVDSVAGSGKTTTNIHIALKFVDWSILLLTYNSKLKLETRERVNLLGVHNLETHSYHSFCVKYYDEVCFTDTVINKILRESINPRKNFSYDLIILDESQDISPTYYELVCKIYKDNLKEAKIVILGDKYQSIFDFNRADQRYITMATKLFNFNEIEWRESKLSVSFRITREMSLFINNCMLGEERIGADKVSSWKPRYIICDCFGDKMGSSERTFLEVKYYLRLGYQPSDIFILAPSIKSLGSPVRQLENKIKRELSNVSVYVPTSEEEELNREILEGKMVFSTFHQTKGLERKVVIVFNFDDSYFRFYKKDKNPNVCPNELYVACTRGLERLSLFHHYQNNYLSFLDKSKLGVYCDVENHKINVNNNLKQKNVDTSVSDLIRHINPNILDECVSYLDMKKIRRRDVRIDIALKTQQVDGVESVSEITGIAIPSYFELKKKGRMNILRSLRMMDFEEKVKPKRSESLFADFKFKGKEKEKGYKLEGIDEKNMSPEELLYISNCWNTYKTGYLFKIYQIKEYDWMPKEKLDLCIGRLEGLGISDNAVFEYECVKEDRKELMDRKLIGFFDCMDGDKLYEFKCVQKLEREHFLQLGLYMYLNEENKMDMIGNLCRDMERLEKERKLLGSELEYKEKMEKLKIGEGDKILYRFVDLEEVRIRKMYKNGRIDVERGGKSVKIERGNVVRILEKGKFKDERLESRIEEIGKIMEKKMIEMEGLKKKTKYYLYNILTDEMYRIYCELEGLKKMVEFLIYSKYINSRVITDEEFMVENGKIYGRYYEKKNSI